MVHRRGTASPPPPPAARLQSRKSIVSAQPRRGDEPGTDQFTPFVGDSSMRNLFHTVAAAISGPSRTRNAPKTNRRAPLNLEVLGERTLLSVSPIHAIAVHPALVLRYPI